MHGINGILQFSADTHTDTVFSYEIMHGEENSKK